MYLNARSFPGADITQMKDKDVNSWLNKDLLAAYDNVARCPLPIVAAINGFALGGGCELAMMCDIMICSSGAKFGQPEIKLGTIPGAGGTQRLIRAVGKSTAMDLILSGRTMDAQEALRRGLVSAVYAPEELLPKALELATQIAGMSLPITRLAKEAVNIAFESTLSQGFHSERKIFHSTFAFRDQREGMSAFVEKRPAKFSHC
jgi:enoyl-CoA hydratase